MAEESPAAVVEENTALESPKPKQVKKLLIVAGGLIFLILGGAGAIILFAPQLLPDSLDFFGVKAHPEEAKKDSKAVHVHGHIHTMDPFLVNLANAEAPRYLKVKVEIESQGAKPSEEFDNRLPQIRDTILVILSSKTSKEIVDSTGKAKLKEEILLKVNQLLNGVKVKAIYFTEFVVQ
jgi:flagellar protein FliL